MKTKIRWTGTAVTLVALLMVGGMVVLLAANDSDSSRQAASPQLSSQVTPDRIGAIQDSLYAVINEEFKLVQPIFQHGCYDCHSKFTTYPWYHKLPLVKSMIDNDIKNGRKHVDFSDGFPFGGKGTILEILRDIRSEINETDMPPITYRMMHWGTAIKGVKQDTVFAFLDSAITTLTAFYDREHIPYKKDSADSKD